jgi:hypothetical protein
MLLRLMDPTFDGHAGKDVITLRGEIVTRASTTLAPKTKKTGQNASP